jgi:hypothetical protein
MKALLTPAPIIFTLLSNISWKVAKEVVDTVVNRNKADNQ